MTAVFFLLLGYRLIDIFDEYSGKKSACLLVHFLKEYFQTTRCYDSGPAVVIIIGQNCIFVSYVTIFVVLKSIVIS